MTALDYMEKQIRKHRIDFEKEGKRGVPVEMLNNIQFKIRCYEAAVEALKKDGEHRKEENVCN